MISSRKLKKLFSFDLLQSISEHASRWTHPVSTRKILGTLDREEFEKLRERYPYRSDSAKINRFEDAVYWIGINVERAQDHRIGELLFSREIRRCDHPAASFG